MPSSIYDHIFAFDILLKCTLWYFLVIIYMYLMIFLRRTEWLPQKSSAHSRKYCRIKKNRCWFRYIDDWFRYTDDWFWYPDVWFWINQWLILNKPMTALRYPATCGSIMNVWDRFFISETQAMHCWSDNQIGSLITIYGVRYYWNKRVPMKQGGKHHTI